MRRPGGLLILLTVKILANESEFFFDTVVAQARIIWIPAFEISRRVVEDRSSWSLVIYVYFPGKRNQGFLFC